MNPNPVNSNESLPEPRDIQPLVEALGGLYGAPVPVPPAVDQAVVARARLRLGSSRRPMPRWLVPFAAAACLALAIGVYSMTHSPSGVEDSGGASMASKPPAPHPADGRGFREWTGSTDAGSPPAGTPAPAVVPSDAVTVRTSVAEERHAPPREDFDRNGRVDILDAFGLARRLEGAAAPGPEWDLNGDGVVDRRDVDVMAMAAVRIAETPR